VFSWLQEDLKEFFPYLEVYWLTGKNHSLGSIIACRVPVALHLPSGSMSTSGRIKGMKKRAPKIELFRMWKVPSSASLQSAFDGVVPFFADSANYDERFLSAYLALLSQGQISPHSLPPLNEEKEEP